MINKETKIHCKATVDDIEEVINKLHGILDNLTESVTVLEEKFQIHAYELKMLKESIKESCCVPVSLVENTSQPQKFHLDIDEYL